MIQETKLRGFVVAEAQTFLTNHGINQYMKRVNGFNDKVKVDLVNQHFYFYEEEEESYEDIIPTSD